MAGRYDPLRNYRFAVAMGTQGVAGGFQKVSGIGANVEVIEYREGIDQPHVKKLTGMESFDEVTLERGVVASNSDLWKFMVKSIETDDITSTTDMTTKSFIDIQESNTAAEGYHTNITITAMDKTGTEVRNYILHNAFASSYKLSDLDASSNEVFVATLTVVYEYLTIEGV